MVVGVGVEAVVEVEVVLLDILGQIHLLPVRESQVTAVVKAGENSQRTQRELPENSQPAEEASQP